MRRRTTLFVAGLLSAGCLLGSSCAVTQRFELRDQNSRVDWSAFELDEVIARLPDVDLERTFDPVTREWTDHPAVVELRTRIRKEVALSDDQWREALTLSGAIRWREKWPVNEPYAISLREAGWAGFTHLSVTPRRQGMQAAECGKLEGVFCGLALQHAQEQAFHSELGFLPLGCHLLEFDVVVAIGEFRSAGGPWGMLWRGSLSLEVEVVDHSDEVLPPRRDEELLAAIRDSIQIRRGKEPSSAFFQFVHDDARRIALSATAICAEVELLHDGKVVEQHGPEWHVRNGFFDSGPPELPPQRHGDRRLGQVPPPGAPLEGWTVRVRGVPARAVRWWGAESRFDGVVEVPLADVLRKDT